MRLIALRSIAGDGGAVFLLRLTAPPFVFDSLYALKGEQMDEQIKALLLQITGFLTLMSKGIVPVPDHAKQEAMELINKIGNAIKGQER